MKRRWAVLLATIMAIGSIVGCGGESKGDEENNVSQGEKSKNEVSEEKITIDFWNSWTGSDGETPVSYTHLKMEKNS